MKLSLRQRAAITARGYGMLAKYCPGLAQGRALSALIAALQPFASIWFSAQIIQEISAARRPGTLMACVLAVVGISAAASLIRAVLDRACAERESLMWSFFGKVFADKQMDLDYSDLENARIQHQKKQAEENLYMFGNGLAQLVWGIPGLVKAPVSILVSLSMVITLFTRQTGNRLIDSQAWIAIVLLGVVLGGLSHSRATIQENKVFEAWCKTTVRFNRLHAFFGRDLYMEPERAKDVRIYEQHRTADRVLGQLVEKEKGGDGFILKMAAYPALASVVIGLSNAAGYLYVALKAFLGAFGVGSIVQYVGVLGRLSDGIQEMMYVLADNAVYCTHLQSLFDYLDLPSSKQEGGLPIPRQEPGDPGPVIEFRDVSFQYPGAEVYALRHVSITLRAGQRLAVVGQNGSGKTTFIKLLCRLYEPTAGQILLGGVDIRQYDYAEYLSLFSVVFQDFKLFSFGLGENVAASRDYDAARAEACLREAGLGDRLQAMPQGLETCLNKDFDGVELSGGEAQKLALARALYRDAPHIILDEPTAALDPIAEYEVFSKFNQIIGSRAALYISHRLASCRFCDEIAVFDQGRIIQCGSHEALLEAAGGKYRALWDAQAQYYQISQ